MAISGECKSGISPPIVGIIIRQVKTTICMDKRCVGVRSVIPFIRDRVVWETQIGYSAHISIPPIPLGRKRITRLVCFLKSLSVVPRTIITRRIIPNESRVVIAGNRKRINAQEQNRCQYYEEPEPNGAHRLILILYLEIIRQDNNR